MPEPHMEFLTCEDETSPERAISPPMSLMTARIDTLNLAARPHRALVESNNYTIGDIVRYTERDLRAINGIGRKSLDALKKTLAGRGLALRTHLEGMPTPATPERKDVC